MIDKKIIKRKYEKLKILGNGEIKEKLKIKTDFISKSAKTKIEKVGGSVTILNKKADKKTTLNKPEKNKWLKNL